MNHAPKSQSEAPPGDLRPPLSVLIGLRTDGLEISHPGWSGEAPDLTSPVFTQVSFTQGASRVASAMDKVSCVDLQGST